MSLEIFIGLPRCRIVTKTALLAYLDEELQGAPSTGVRLADGPDGHAAVGHAVASLRDFLFDFARLEAEDALVPAGQDEISMNAATLVTPLPTAIRLSLSWELAKSGLQRAKMLARQHGLLLYCINTEEWLNATRPREPHRAGEVYTSERGRITYLAQLDAERLTDSTWFTEEASFGFVLSPELTLEALVLPDRYALDLRLGGPDCEFRAVTNRLSLVREILERFYAGDCDAFRLLEFKSSQPGVLPVHD